MKSPLAQTTAPAASEGPGPLASFLRFVVLGGGVGVLSSLAVAVVATTVPWAVANALITLVSTLLCTELHARFTFGKGRSAGWREHWQSAGSASAAYLVTGVAVYVLHLLQSSPGALTEQIVYLSASGLAGAGRFLALRLYVFAARRQTRSTPPPVRRTVPQFTLPGPRVRNNGVPRVVLMSVAAEGTVSPGLTYSPWGRSFG
ncbi:GtrA family protein [Streptomyces kunmingensis]|uniref:GtrA family protein n=1 Tax=Streptomyces kunmingensis TaxID=68225 RepID=A0ABU6CQX3_9ACTN|nr:GtrA family protein [Streptomyces kunmingensis]MEB3967077.1 GtrA family protein [Streptomyces kunmingensis]